MSSSRSRLPFQLYLGTVRCWIAIGDRGVGIPEDGLHPGDANAKTKRGVRSGSLPPRLLPARRRQPVGERGTDIDEDRRYVVCCNPEQTKKDAQDRRAILEALVKKLKQGTKALVGNRGFR